MKAHPKSILYRLLYMGFVDIREATRENFALKALCISEFLAALPVELYHLLDDQESSMLVLDRLKLRLNGKNLRFWLENVLGEIDVHFDTWEAHKRESFLHLRDIGESGGRDVKKLLHGLLYVAFTEIKDDSATTFSKKIFVISDLLHGLPLHLDMASRGVLKYSKVLESLKVRVIDRGYIVWPEWLTVTLDCVERDIEQYIPE